MKIKDNKSLMKRLAESDISALEDIYVVFAPKVRSFVTHYIGKEEAEDLTQDTFLAAYLHRDTIPAGYERQWLARIAANKAKDHLQSAWNRRTVLPGDEGIPPGLAPPAETEALAHSGAAEIAELIGGLREPYGPVCRLCLLEERSPEEAALALGRPVKTIHTQLARGKKLLRQQLERRARDGILSP